MNTNENTVLSTSIPHTRWAQLREELRQRHSARAGRRALEAQLASHSTEAQRTELEAIFGRYEGAEVAELRTILQRSRTAA